MPSSSTSNDSEDQDQDQDILDPPTDIDPYQILSVPQTSTPAEIRTAYRKLALLHHPDKVSSTTDKAAAHIKFQEIAFAYSILSDEKRRERYDRTGSTSERDVDDDDFDWKSFYGELYKDVVNGETLVQFKESYQGSEEERDDLLEAYTRFSGDLDSIFQYVMLSDPIADEERFRKIIDSAIESKDVESFKVYTHEPAKQRQARRKQAENEGKAAMEYAKKLGVYDKLFGKDEENDTNGTSNDSSKKKQKKKETNPEDDPNHPLAALIRSRQGGRGMSFLDNLEKKYAGGNANRNKRKKKVAKDYDEDDDDEGEENMPTEEEFQATRKKLQTKAPKASTNIKKKKAKK